MIQGAGILSQEKAFDDRDEWRLLADELSLLPGLTDTGRLGFVLQLKFRQVQGHYPNSVHDFPSGIVHTIAEQVGCASVSPENYLFQGRQVQRHRQHIRRYLGVRLPSKADIARQKLYACEKEDTSLYPHLMPVLTRGIDWELIAQQYDKIIKYTEALKTGTAEPETILRRFTRNNIQHPTYKALAELGKAIKTIFLCHYCRMSRCVAKLMRVSTSWKTARPER